MERRVEFADAVGNPAGMHREQDDHVDGHLSARSRMQDVILRDGTSVL